MAKILKEGEEIVVRINFPEDGEASVEEIDIPQSESESLEAVQMEGFSVSDKVDDPLPQIDERSEDKISIQEAIPVAIVGKPGLALQVDEKITTTESEPTQELESTTVSRRELVPPENVVDEIINELPQEPPSPIDPLVPAEPDSHIASLPPIESLPPTVPTSPLDASSSPRGQIEGPLPETVINMPLAAEEVRSLEEVVIPPAGADMTNHTSASDFGGVAEGLSSASQGLIKSRSRSSKIVVGCLAALFIGFVIIVLIVTGIVAGTGA